MNISELLSTIPVISKVRRNHALEHAMLHVLSKKNRGKFMAGHSNAGSINIVGSFNTEEVAAAAEEALNRLRNGEKHLAVHPNCGTNYVTTGILAGAAGWLGMLGCEVDIRRKLERLPIVIALVTIVMVLSRPLGPGIQKHITTDPNPGKLRVTDVIRKERGNVTVHNIKINQ